MNHPGRVLGLDPGERRVGVALSDELRILATPLTIVHRRSLAADLATIRELVDAHDVVAVVVGHPKTIRGEIGPQARKAERFADNVQRAVSRTVILWDERYSTIEAEDRLSNRRRPTNGKRVHADAAAAAVILQGYLDSRR